jgi:hypothetical protein
LHQDEPLCVPLLIPPPRGSRHRVVTVPKSLLPRRPFGLCLGGKVSIAYSEVSTPVVSW